MGYNIAFVTDEASTITDLCTNKGLALVTDWVAALPAQRFPTLAAFIRDGTVKNTKALAEELDVARHAYPVDKDALAHTLERLADLIGVGDENETAELSQ
jgi:hypothetical protein